MGFGAERNKIAPDERAGGFQKLQIENKASEQGPGRNAILRGESEEAGGGMRFRAMRSACGRREMRFLRELQPIVAHSKTP